MNLNFNSSIAVKAGLIGAAAGFVVAILGRIPFLGCIIAPLGWLVAVGAGVLYVHFATSGGAAVQIAEGAVGGAVSGGIAGLVQALISGVLALLFGGVRAATSALGQGEVGEAAFGAGVGLVAVVFAIIAGTVFGAVLGAIGGLVYAALKNQKA
jgi:hypothetical protein